MDAHYTGPCSAIKHANFPEQLRLSLLQAVQKATRAPDVQFEHLRIFRCYIFPASRDLPSIDAGNGSRAADTVLLKATLPSLIDQPHFVSLAPKQLCWAEVVAVVSHREAIWIVFRPFVLPQGRRAVVDRVPLVARDKNTPLIAVHPNTVLAPVHVVPCLPALDELRNVVDPSDLLWVNWWIFRSNCKYPVSIRDKQLGLRGHTVGKK